MRLKNLVFKLSGVLCTLALAVGTTSVNTACAGWFHQPKVPEGMNKYVK